VTNGEPDLTIATKFRGIDVLEYTPLIQDSFGAICRSDYPIQPRTAVPVSIHCQPLTSTISGFESLKSYELATQSWCISRSW